MNATVPSPTPADIRRKLINDAKAWEKECDGGALAPGLSIVDKVAHEAREIGKLFDSIAERFRTTGLDNLHISFEYERFMQHPQAPCAFYRDAEEWGLVLTRENLEQYQKAAKSAQHTVERVEGKFQMLKKRAHGDLSIDWCPRQVQGVVYESAVIITPLSDRGKVAYLRSDLQLKRYTPLGTPPFFAVEMGSEITERGLDILFEEDDVWNKDLGVTRYMRGRTREVPIPGFSDLLYAVKPLPASRYSLELTILPVIQEKCRARLADYCTFPSEVSLRPMSSVCSITHRWH